MQNSMLLMLMTVMCGEPRLRMLGVLEGWEVCSKRTKCQTYSPGQFILSRVHMPTRPLLHMQSTPTPPTPPLARSSILLECFLLAINDSRLFFRDEDASTWLPSKEQPSSRGYSSLTVGRSAGSACREAGQGKERGQPSHVASSMAQKRQAA